MLSSKSLAETTDPKRSCSNTLDSIRTKAMSMKMENNGERLTPDQVAELREIVENDKKYHRVIAWNLNRVER